MLEVIYGHFQTAVKRMAALQPLQNVQISGQQSPEEVLRGNNTILKTGGEC